MNVSHAGMILFLWINGTCNIYLYHFRPQGKVMFLQLSVCPQGGLPSGWTPPPPLDRDTSSPLDRDPPEQRPLYRDPAAPLDRDPPRQRPNRQRPPQKKRPPGPDM